MCVRDVTLPLTIPSIIQLSPHSQKLSLPNAGEDVAGKKHLHIVVGL